jgi:hypothetical protein
LKGSASLSVKISIVALVAVLLGSLKGVLFAAIASLPMLVAGAARRQVAFLGRIPGTRRYSDLEHHRDSEAVPGVAIFRTEPSPPYFNVERVRQVVRDKLQATPELRLVVCDLSDAPVVDVAGSNMLARLHRDLTKREARLRVVEADAKVRDMLRAVGSRPAMPISFPSLPEAWPVLAGLNIAGPVGTRRLTRRASCRQGVLSGGIRSIASLTRPRRTPIVGGAPVGQRGTDWRRATTAQPRDRERGWALSPPLPDRGSSP